MTKKEHVPGMRDTTVKPNREQRRHPEKLEQPEDEGISRDVQANVVQDGSQDVQSVRAKNSGHGKKTADKWNQ
jgi:hypothetical protein